MQNNEKIINKEKQQYSSEYLTYNRKPSSIHDNMGQATAFALKHIQHNSIRTYLYLAQRTVGYCQATSDSTSITRIMKHTGLSNKGVISHLKYLIDNNFIKKVATNQVANIGKVAYKYQLVFDRKIYPDAPHYDLSREGSTTESTVTDSSISYEHHTYFYRYVDKHGDLSSLTGMPSTESRYNTFLEHKDKVLANESYFAGIYTNIKGETKKNYDKSIKATIDARKHKNIYALKAYKLLKE